MLWQKATETRYSDQKPIFEIETRYESFLATDGEKLYYSDGSAIYSLEPATMKTEPEPEPEDLKGDVNGNGKIDAQDYMLAKRHCLRTYILVDEMAKRGDINGNGSIEASEYALIKRHYLGTFVII
ncbi:MAG: dockerin type I repeat-containing protein [Clostridia bacterium]|nr:dockerin type I repeat-containing protein [Clostridia bacterium]